MILVLKFCGLIFGALSVLTLLHSEQPKLHRVLAILSAIGLIKLNLGITLNIQVLRQCAMQTPVIMVVCVNNETMPMPVIVI